MHYRLKRYQWICDACQEMIGQPEQGLLTFRSREGKEEVAHYDYQIVHRQGYGPHGKLGCARLPVQNEMSLDVLLQGGPGVFLLELHWGSVFSKEEAPRCRSVREWSDTFRRLYVRGYEEARFYLEEARGDGQADGPLWGSSPVQLLELIERYRKYAARRPAKGQVVPDTSERRLPEIP